MNVMDIIRAAPTEREKKTGKLDIGIVPDRDHALLARNEFTYFVEEYSPPERDE